MSTALVAKAFQIKVGNPTRKIVLVKLADNMNDKGFGFPSYDTIAELCEVSRRSVIRHCQALADDNLLKITQRKTKHGHTSNLFQLNIPLVNQRIAEQEAQRLAELSGDDNLSPLEWSEDHYPGDTESEKLDTMSPPSVSEDHHPSDTESEKLDTVSPRTINERSINRKDLVGASTNKKSLTDKFDFSKWPAAPSEQVFADWVNARAKAKKPLTQAAVDYVAPEIHKAANAGMSVDDCLRVTLGEGWQGFKFDWAVNRGLVQTTEQALPHWTEQVFDDGDPLI